MVHSDPCCGSIVEIRYRTRGAVNDPANCRLVPTNPCNLDSNGLANCYIARKRNREFADLATNKLNTSCDCASLRDGFAWNEDAKMCVGTSGRLQHMNIRTLIAKSLIAQC